MSCAHAAVSRDMNSDLAQTCRIPPALCHSPLLPCPACCASPCPLCLTSQGPRVKMGVYSGMPTRVMPHTTTGRADYFGPMVSPLTVLWVHVHVCM